MFLTRLILYVIEPMKIFGIFFLHAIAYLFVNIILFLVGQKIYIFFLIHFQEVHQIFLLIVYLLMHSHLLLSLNN